MCWSGWRICQLLTATANLDSPYYTVCSTSRKGLGLGFNNVENILRSLVLHSCLKSLSLKQRAIKWFEGPGRFQKLPESCWTISRPDVFSNGLHGAELWPQIKHNTIQNNAYLCVSISSLMFLKCFPLMLAWGFKFGFSMPTRILPSFGVREPLLILIAESSPPNKRQDRNKCMLTSWI